MNKYVTVSFTGSQDPHTKNKVLTKLQFVSKTKAYPDFNDVKSDVLRQIKSFHHRNDIYESDFKLVHLNFGIHSPVEYDVNVQPDTTWKELHENVMSTMYEKSPRWYSYAGFDVENVKLGFDAFNSFSYWNKPWNTVDDNDSIFITHTKRKNQWKKLMTGY
jgi:hypothetical protein